MEAGKTKNMMIERLLGVGRGMLACFLTSLVMKTMTVQTHMSV